MSQALAHIRTRKLPATDVRGAQILAYTTDRAKQMTIPYPHEASDPHWYAARTLARTLAQSDDISVQEVSCYAQGKKYRVVPAS